MEKKKQKFKLKTLLFSILLVFSIFFSNFNLNTTNAGSTINPDVSGGTTTPTTDYSLYLTDLKEENTSVFVYVYQPANDKIVLATSINISIDLEKLSFKNYKLEYVSKDNENYIFKYLVKDLKISNNDKRVYEISCIYRLFREDDVTYKYDDAGNTTTEKAFAVEKCYTYLTNEDGTTSVSVLETETIYITDKFVGFVRYLGGYGSYTTACDNHFVAFSTDKQIDTLREADVYYTTMSCVTDLYSLTTYGEEEYQYAYLTGEKEVYQGVGLFANRYTWNEIETVDDFINGIEENIIYTQGIFNSTTETELTEETKASLKDKQWVLRFASTLYVEPGFNIVSQGHYEKTIVGDVAILRLKFETGGTLFEYGVTDDKTTGSTEPVISVGSSSNFLDRFLANLNKFWDKFKVIVGVILLILLILVLAPFLAPVINLLLIILKPIIKGIEFVITLPFKIFKGGKRK